ncbi:MAG: HAD family hydrolase [Nitrososphaerales archaeon]
MYDDLKGYNEYGSISGPIYLKEESGPRSVAKIAAIFDCDGVLIDAKQSYNLAIGETVSLFMAECFGLDLDSSYISDEIIYRFRASGGFNNDWDLTYFVILWLLSNLLNKDAKVRDKIDSKDFNRSILSLRSLMNSGGKEGLLKDIISSMSRDLLVLADRADSTGIKSLKNGISLGPEMLENVSLLLGYPGDFQNSLMVRMFEEIFYGKTLFQETYGANTIFYSGNGLINNERIIVDESTLQKISEGVGKQSLGIASGRSLFSTRFTLKNLLNYFNPKGMVFIEDEVRKEDPQTLNSIVMDVGKPSPFSLLKACNEMGESERILYVGDSMEDLLMVKNANVHDKRIEFVGVYSSGISSSEKISTMAGNGASALIPSVNELPIVIARIGDQRN